MKVFFKKNNICKFFISKIILIVFMSSLAGCGEKAMQKLGLRKEQVDAFAVSRKDPLIMPPDMTLRPPGNEDRNSNSLQSTIKQSNNDSSLSIDEILMDNDEKKYKKAKSKTRSYKLISNILKAKADAILD